MENNSKEDYKKKINEILDSLDETQKLRFVYAFLKELFIDK